MYLTLCLFLDMRAAMAAATVTAGAADEISDRQSVIERDTYRSPTADR
jgi:hypothetical protein